jgi:hypothetical protein
VVRPFKSLTLSLATLVNGLLVTLGNTGVAESVAPRWYPTALGVFFRFQVTDFDRFLGFFSLCHFIFLAIYFGLFGRCVVSVTPKGN